MTARPLYALLLLTLGCGQPEEGEAPLACPGARITLTDQANFSYQGDLSIPELVTAEASDVDICWSDLAHDMRCREIEPALDVDNVALVRLPHLTREEVSSGLANGTLLASDMSGYVESRNDAEETCTSLASMSFFGTPIDLDEHYTEDGGTYLLLLSTGTSIGLGTRMLAFLAPTATSDVTEVMVPDGCGVLDFDADLTSLAPVVACQEGPWDVTWGGLTTDGHGQPMDLDSVDGLMLGFFEAVEPSELEDGFLDLESLATRIWNTDLEGGTMADLSEALDGDGEPFSGFEGQGTWILALTCSRCHNPAPPFLTIIEPQP